jgi:hypothetical protein
MAHQFSKPPTTLTFIPISEFGEKASIDIIACGTFDRPTPSLKGLSNVRQAFDMPSERSNVSNGGQGLSNLFEAYRTFECGPGPIDRSTGRSSGPILSNVRLWARAYRPLDKPWPIERSTPQHKPQPIERMFDIPRPSHVRASAGSISPSGDVLSTGSRLTLSKNQK